ncbi:hypothetical protein PV08_08366 [Exophiala spinifera]|uniref:Protein NO VEIN C-terminal domain-containing protein n=1 Tax=Exophiala spinifera TaxID=91928 RepID=A0A0D2BPX8_9EURO|nr:uncharacterized protein PV08_08366 [Exophiala spinifera]KIW13179.1 hypothetical protein PV08_08366 [Exophiala spinifera]
MGIPGFDDEERPLTAAAAKREIEAIRVKHGIISDDDEAEIRQWEERPQKNYRTMAGSLRESSAGHAKTSVQSSYLGVRYTNVGSVSEQLYSSKFRFIHELLQNVDDSEYAEHVRPSVTFRIQPRQLIVESTEKGFTLENVISICSVGKSSKARVIGTTGEKGLGFKSVFGIADYAHIKSGHWSFGFKHRKGEDGLGMVAPLWIDDTAPLSKGIGTRLTLRYSDHSTNFAGRLVSEFEKIPKTIMFALRQLKKLEVFVDCVDGRSDRLKLEKPRHLYPYKMRIETTVEGNFGAHTSGTTVLRLLTTKVRDLPCDDRENRHPKNKVTVAFEVGHTGRPVITTSGQHVFACLPVESIPQLPFLINADFVLTASREQIQVLTRGDPLEFKWMRYLPKPPMTGFWEHLWEDVCLTLEDEKVLRSAQGKLHTIAHVKSLPSWFMFEDEPLVADTRDDIYLSKKYESADTRILKNLGLEQISQTQILRRIKLAIPFHDKPLDDPWHTAFSELVEKLLECSDTEEKVKDLRIIPLKDGQWVSSASRYENPVYYPYLIDEGNIKIEIPDGLGLQKVHETAAGDGERRKLYNHLGISDCPPDVVTKKILHAHASWERVICEGDGVVHTFQTDLEILFWFNEMPNKNSAILVSKNERLYRGHFLFFPSKDKFDAEELLAKTQHREWGDYGILHEEYMKSKVSSRIKSGLTWMSYLENCGVKHFPDLTQKDSSGWKLHPLMTLIARDNPDSFVANLHAHWSQYCEEASRITNDLLDIQVPCLYNTTEVLRRTILPTHELRGKSRDLNLERRLPLLKLPTEFDPKQPDDWFFLKQFGVICGIELEFYLRALESLADLAEMNVIQTCGSIYGGIAQTASINETESIQQKFAEQSLIRATSMKEGWYKSSDCIWEGPAFLHTKQRLGPLYGDDKYASKFFTNILNMRDVNHDDLIDELKLLATEARDGPHSTKDRAEKIYTALAGIAISEPIVETIRYKFRDHSLIYTDQTWRKSTECLWNCTVTIPGRVPLDEMFPQLQNFFVDKVEVLPLKIDMLIEDLVKAVEEQRTDFQKVKQIILAIGQLLASDDAIDLNEDLNEDQKRTLNELAWLPVSGPGGLKLVSPESKETFAINDHQRYGELFENRADIVAFGYEQISELHRLFWTLDLEDRYISGLVYHGKTTTEGDPKLDQALGQYIRDRAYALSCCATYYNSGEYYNRNTWMHEALLAAKVFVCDKVWANLCLPLPEDAEDIIVPSDQVVADVGLVDEGLKICMPSSKDKIYSYFQTELPEALFSLFKLEKELAVKAIYRILNNQRRPLKAIMREEDIPEYSWFKKYPPLLQETPFALRDDAESRSSSSTPMSPTVVSSAGSSLADSDGACDDDDDEEEEEEEEEDEVVTRADHRSTAENLGVEKSVPFPAQTQLNLRQREEPYKKLLREVIRQAKQGRPPQRAGQRSLEEINEDLDTMQALDESEYEAFRRAFGGTGYGNFEENTRMGAAGELYVFELFKAWGVTDFGIDNWQSSIRHHVNVLPEYAAEAAWHGREQSDIMYEGSCAQLRRLLRKKTIFPCPGWLCSETSSTPVNYHIEVKTTSGSCNTPFFISNKQYELMETNAYPPGSVTPPRD